MCTGSCIGRVVDVSTVMQAVPGGHSRVGTRFFIISSAFDVLCWFQCLLCHRYASMISDLEATRQQSWEDKAKLSAQYEQERTRMVRVDALDCSVML